MENKREVVKKLDEIAEKIYGDLIKNEIPSLTLPTRTKSNIVFDEHFGVWKYGKGITSRAAKSLDGAYMLLRTMYV
ncbi:MAG TPA: DNA topoisomerase VI, partial [Thermoplasmatales archaeon]|nr:DNA topoisomerase VI [Thermoplasmatales archaeon]